MTIDPRLQLQLDDHPYPLLFATIGGAHLHGFASPGSDFDLRGAHVLPLRTVIGLHLPHETIERSGVRDGLAFDLATHDVGMFFGLLLKKNGYLLEQLLSPHVLRTSPEHDELRAIAASTVTKRHVHHYFGLAETQRKLLVKAEHPQAKTLLHIYRALLTGLHLMRTGEVEANLVRLNETVRLPYIDELIGRKIAGPDTSVLERTELPFHEREYERLREELQTAFETSALPEAPSKETSAALNELLVRIRLAAC